MKFTFFFRKKKICVDLKKTNFVTKGLGLTFRTKNTKNLLFEFRKLVTWEGNLTSVFVFFPFLTLWLDEKNRVIDFRIVKPFILTINQKNKFKRIIEMPLNDKNRKIIEKIIGKSESLKYYRL